ncbi:MAG TPA: hypothetical protein VNV38_22055 [Stellaceae bacterium]|jgi:hypothetical protein|nr:hypothetical protein [Stellaceae bacterium]
MEAANENRPADTDYKRGLLRFAPWKIVIAAFAAAIIFGALGYKLDSIPPPPIVSQQLPPPAAH